MTTLKNAVLQYLKAVTETAQDKPRLIKITSAIKTKQILDTAVHAEKVRDFAHVLLTEMPELKIPAQFEKIIPLAQHCINLNSPTRSHKPK